MSGDIKADGDILLAGADCAEHFDVADTDVLEPGTVVVIDEDGRLAALPALRSSKGG